MYHANGIDWNYHQLCFLSISFYSILTHELPQEGPFGLPSQMELQVKRKRIICKIDFFHTIMSITFIYLCTNSFRMVEPMRHGLIFCVPQSKYLSRERIWKH
ncbi:hypothetical protein BpHYR1_049143 [Brachionus plicatilis]|uniref:Uncharacterized protein n=1 Tax=Brachionus plicatilis TaxID=10195 RepID=A0A3M7SKG3_BRAPC|nr:hypothetical protein BpHYR1_049143 [Brachionus plicatilis]